MRPRQQLNFPDSKDPYEAGGEYGDQALLYREGALPCKVGGGYWQE